MQIADVGILQHLPRVVVYEGVEQAVQVGNYGTDDQKSDRESVRRTSPFGESVKMGRVKPGVPRAIKRNDRATFRLARSLEELFSYRILGGEPTLQKPPGEC